MVNWSLHCTYCGHFVGWGSDSYTPFGGALDVDPPDPEHLCRDCVRREYQRAIRERRLPAHWHPARWEYRAAKRLGFVKAGPAGAAWGHWFAPDSLPAGYVIEGPVPPRAAE